MKHTNLLIAAAAGFVAAKLYKGAGSVGGGIGSFRKGSTVTLSASAIENDGYVEWFEKNGYDPETVKLKITTVSRSTEDHPGYDESVGGNLYDLEIKSTGQSVPFSLYEWEVE